MSPEESEAISLSHSEYVKSYKNWFQNRDRILKEKYCFNHAIGTVDCYIQASSLELEMENLYTDLLVNRLHFYQVLKTYWFTGISFHKQFSYTITRISATDGGKKECYTIKDE